MTADYFFGGGVLATEKPMWPPQNMPMNRPMTIPTNSTRYHGSCAMKAPMELPFVGGGTRIVAERLIPRYYPKGQSSRNRRFQ